VEDSVSDQVLLRDAESSVPASPSSPPSGKFGSPRRELSNSRLASLFEGFIRTLNC